MRNMGDEFHTKEVLTPSTPGTPTSPPVILSKFRTNKLG